MLQSKRMVQALKQALRRRRVSYEQVARHLGLSLSSVKRLFSTGDFTLERIEAVCDLADIDLLELARLGNAERLRTMSLSEDQERELVDDPILLLVAVCSLNRWRFDRIVEKYRISETQLIGCLVRLDRLGLIELLPGNRIKPRIARGFAWLPDGPIQRYFVEHVQNSFLSGTFMPGKDVHRFSWGMLSPESAAMLREKLVELMDTFDALTRGDEIRPTEELRTRGSCLLVALREWEPEEFLALRRDERSRI